MGPANFVRILLAFLAAFLDAKTADFLELRDVRECLVQACIAKNEISRVKWYTPEQAVLGIPVSFQLPTLQTRNRRVICLRQVRLRKVISFVSLERLRPEPERPS